jgi:parallel beta-helix repeat protein
MRIPVKLLIAVCSGTLIACADDDGGAAASAAQSGHDHPGSAPCSVELSPGDDDRSALQGALIEAEPGATICLGRGRYALDGQLSLDVDGVTVRGEDGTVLDFSEQTSGANGFEITANQVTFEHVRIENPKGDGLRATEVEDLIVRDVHVEWTAGPSRDNGGYGIYPVTSTGVLIEDCYASGAADTGIYVGQSSRIVIRNNEVTQNVAGIEVENSTDAEVYGNHAYDNSAGILLFNLPGLPVKDGKRVSVHDNVIVDNNHENFAAPGNIVAEVPVGTGMFVLASDDNEVRDNEIRGNQSGGVSVVSWFVVSRDEEGELDPDFDWFPERNYVHGNSFADNGDAPQGTAAVIAGLVGQEALADMVWDGIVDSEKLDPAADDAAAGELAGGVAPEPLRNCFEDNGIATFLNIDLEHAGAGKSSDVGPYACSRPALPAIEL